MKNPKLLSAIVCLAAIAFTGACSSDDSSSPGGGGSATGGNSGTGGGSSGTGGVSGSGGSAGGATGGSAGAGGATGGAGGATGGAAGATGGAGGAGPLTLCGCTEATAVDLTAQSTVTNTFQCCSYDQPCIKIKVGTKVTWSGAFTSHPLTPYATLGTQPNPIQSMSSGTSSEVTFTTAGAYGYYCQFHGGEAAPSGGMCGGIFVVP